jgi:hypothetical protein
VGSLQSIFTGLFQNSTEINVLGFVVRGVSIGNVAREHFHALAAQSQGLSVYTQSVVNHVHDVVSFALLKLPDYRQPEELKFFAMTSIARAVPCFSCRFAMTF